MQVPAIVGRYGALSCKCQPLLAGSIIMQVPAIVGHYHASASHCWGWDSIIMQVPAIVGRYGIALSCKCQPLLAGMG